VSVSRYSWAISSGLCLSENCAQHIAYFRQPIEELRMGRGHC